MISEKRTSTGIDDYRRYHKINVRKMATTVTDDVYKYTWKYCRSNSQSNENIYLEVYKCLWQDNATLWQCLPSIPYREQDQYLSLSIPIR